MVPHSALTLTNFAGRDHADGCFFAIFALILGSDGTPTRFASHNAIFAKIARGSSNTRVLSVDPVLWSVPFESNLLYRMGNNQRPNINNQ